MQRVLTALILIPLLAAAIFGLSDGWFLLFVLLLVELAAYELIRICRGWAPEAPLTLLLLLVPAVTLALAAAVGEGEPAVPAGLPLLTGLVLLSLGASGVVLFGRTPMAQSLPAVGCLSFGTLYLALPAVSFWLLQRQDPWLVVLLLAMVAANDSCAYYAGSSFGRRKLSPVVSPNKTWVGAIAGLLGGVAVTAAWSLWRRGELEPELLLLALLTCTAGQCGDLVESMLKRGAGVKDSGRLLPGHGGMLDRVDSYLFAGPAFVLGLMGLETWMR